MKFGSLLVDIKLFVVNNYDFIFNCTIVPNQNIFHYSQIHVTVQILKLSSFTNINK